jgi:hypothetical protein
MQADDCSLHDAWKHTPEPESGTKPPDAQLQNPVQSFKQPGYGTFSDASTGPSSTPSPYPPLQVPKDRIAAKLADLPALFDRLKSLLAASQP